VGVVGWWHVPVTILRGPTGTVGRGWHTALLCSFSSPGRTLSASSRPGRKLHPVCVESMRLQHTENLLWTNVHLYLWFSCLPGAVFTIACDLKSSYRPVRDLAVLRRSTNCHYLLIISQCIVFSIHTESFQKEKMARV
jgi:hypothetical protein